MQPLGVVLLSSGTLVLGVLIGASFLSGVPTTASRRLLEAISLRGVGPQDPNDDLIGKTTTFLKEGTGYWSPFKREWYADDYVFRGPVIGPFNLEDEEKLLSTAGPYQGFPDLDPGIRNCWLDPKVARLVYCVLYPTGTHTKPWHSPAGLIQPSGHSLDSSGEVWSVMWDEQGKVKHQTVGYPINQHRGNGCGFGATFALACAAKGSGSLVYHSLVAAFVSEWTLGIPKERSKTVAPWWSDYCQGHQCP